VVRALPFKLSVCKMMSSLSDYVPYILAKFSSYLLRPRPSKFQSTGFVIVTSRKNHLPCSHGSSASIPPEIPTSYLVYVGVLLGRESHGVIRLHGASRHPLWHGIRARRTHHPTNCTRHREIWWIGIGGLAGPATVGRGWLGP
jgi:hypothetical protein